MAAAAVLVDHPVVLFVVLLAVLTGAATLGAYVLRRASPLSDEERDNFSIVQTATLTLLALLIGFSLSMAVSRYDQRKNLEEAEANAIGTEYARADLVDGNTSARLKATLLRYLKLRLEDYRTRDAQERERIRKATQEVQSELWRLAIHVAENKPSPIGALVVSGMNDTLNSQDYAEAARINHIPLGAWLLMVLIAASACVVQGYGSKGELRHRLLIIILPATIALSLALIADIDSPRGGIIRVQPENLARLLQSLQS